MKMTYPRSDLSDIKAYCRDHVAGKPDAFDRILALGRYCRFTDHKPGLTYLLTMLGTSGVLESIEERARELAGAQASCVVSALEKKPPLGSLYEEYPAVVKGMLDAMQATLPHTTCRRILAGNHHCIPAERFSEEKRKYAELGSLDAFLRYRHEEMIRNMEECLSENRLWFETRMTRQAIDYVRQNQEIQAGVREGSTVFITKIPYNIDGYLNATDSRERRFHACHCPFVRSSIADGSVSVAQLWCYCTGGFEKRVFDVLFEQEHAVEVLETVLGGSERCRFAIHTTDSTAVLKPVSSDSWTAVTSVFLPDKTDPENP